MNRISFPLHQGNSGSAVAVLQDALFELIKRESLIADQAPQGRQRRLLVLQRERDGQSYSNTTSWLVQQFQRERKLEVTGTVDERTANALNALLRELGLLPEEPRPDQPGFEVRGRVSLADGSPAVGLKVMAVDRDLRHEQELGSETTDRHGAYQIFYSARQFRRAEKRYADLIVRVSSTDGEVLAGSEILFNAPESATVNLLLSEPERQPASEFENLTRELTPLLDGAKLAELTVVDVAFLSGETGINQSLIRDLAWAAKISSESGVDLNVLYGLIREGLPRDLRSLLQQSRSSQQQALEAAIKNKRIAELTEQAINTALDDLEDALPEALLREPDSPSRLSYNALLDSSLSPLSRQQKKAFLKHFLRSPETGKNSWSTIKGLPGFQDEKQVEDLKFTIQVGNLTLGHSPLVHAVQRLRKENHLRSYRDVARLTEADWKNLITESRDEDSPSTPRDIVGETEEERISNYAHQICSQVEQEHPSLSVAYRVEQDNDPSQKDVITFFQRSTLNRGSLNPDVPEFDLASTDIDRFLEEHGDILLAGIQNQDKLAEDLKQIQRLFRITPRYREIRSLLDSRLHSAQSIVRLGVTQFVNRYAEELGSKERAIELYDQAEQKNAMAMALLIKYGSQYHGTGPQVVPGIPQPPKEDPAAVPDWPSLFGSLDFCACPHCQSVYSPGLPESLIRQFSWPCQRFPAPASG